MFVQPKVISIARSYIANDDDINHQQIKGQGLIALPLALYSSNTQTRKTLEKTGMVNNRYALRYNMTEKKNYILLKFIKETILISKFSRWTMITNLMTFDQEFC